MTSKNESLAVANKESSPASSAFNPNHDQKRDNSDAGEQTALNQRQQRRSLKYSELIHRMLDKYNMSHLFPARLSRDDIAEVIAYLLVEREDLLLLSKLESENASIVMNKSAPQRTFSVDGHSPAIAEFINSSSAVTAGGSSNDEEINFFAAVHREVVNALAEENQKLQDKVIEERCRNDELRKLMFAMKSRLALLDPDGSASVLADESSRFETAQETLSYSELQRMGRSRSQPISLAVNIKVSPKTDGESNSESSENLLGASCEPLNTSADDISDEQKLNYKKRMQILSHVITAMQKHYMSEIGLLRKEVQRLRAPQ